MADGQMNIRVNVDLNDMRRKAEEYRKEVTKMGVITDESGNVISTAWQRVSDAAKKSNISRITEEMTGDVSANIEIQKKVLKDLEEQYKSVSKAVQNAAPGTAKSKLQQELSAIKKEIDGEKQALQELEKVQQQYGQSNLTLRTQIANVRNEMGRLRMQGQTNTEQYRQLEEELGRLGTAYRQIQYEQKALSTGATQWGGIISGIQGLTGAFAAAQGVMGMFVTDNEKLAKIQTRLQAVMAITIGMQQVSNTLHATSAFRMTTVRKVTELFTAAQGRLSTALGISTLKAQILMGTLTLGLSAAITGIIYLINKWSSAQKKAAEEQKKIINIQKQSTGSISNQITTYKKLQEQWNNLDKSLENRKKFIIENKDEFERLGVSIKTVDEAENIFVSHQVDFINSIRKRAQAMAAMEVSSEKYKEALSKRIEADALKQNKSTTKTIKSGGVTFKDTQWEDAKYSKQYRKLLAEAEKAEKTAGNYIKKQAEAYKNSNDILEKAGINRFNKNEESRLKLINDVNQKIIESDLKLKSSRLAILSDSRTKMLASIDVETKQKLANINKEQKELEKKYKETGGGNLPESIIKTYNLRRKSIEEEAAKKRFEIEYKYNTKEEKLYEQLTDVFLTEEERKIKSVHKRYDEMRKVARDEYENEVSAIELTKTGKEKEKAKKEATVKYEEIKTLIDSAEVQDNLNEVLQKYKSFSQQRIDIERKYNNDIKILQNQINDHTTDEQKKIIEEAIKVAQKNKDEDLSELSLSFLKKTDFWTRLFSDASEHTNKYISQIIADTQQLIDYMNGVQGVEIPIGFTKEQIDSLKKDPEKVKTILEELKKKRDALNTRNPFRGMIDGFKDLKEAGSDAEAQMKAIGDIINSMNGASTIISGIGDALESMGSKAGSVLNDVANVVGETASMAQTGASLGGPIGAAVGAAVGLATSLTKLFTAKHDAKRDKRIAQLQKQIDKIDKENAKLEKTADKQYGENKAKSLKDENANLEKQNALIEQQIAEERDKKKTDQGKIDEYNRQLEANREKIEENKDAALDAIMGEDIKSAIERFADAYAEAWSKNEDSAAGARASIKKQMQLMVTEAIKAYIQSSDKMKKIREQMDKYFADGVFTQAEQDALYKMADDLDREIEKRYGANKGLFQEDSEEALKRQTGTISETITEKTANESMGIWRGSYDTLKSISQQTTMFHETYKSTMATCNSILNTIARNTGETANNTSVLSDMHSTLKSMDGRLRTIESESSKRYAR